MTDERALDAIKDDVLGLADYAFGRLRQRIEGLSDEEYLWEPAPGCWSVRPVGDGTFRADWVRPEPVPPPLTTIAWRLDHLVGLLAGERNATWIGVTPTGTLDRAGAAGTAAAAGAQLDEAFTLFRGHVAAVDAATLADPIGPIGRQFAENTRVAFVFHELDELIHHGAEVGVLRDLYRATHVA